MIRNSRYLNYKLWKMVKSREQMLISGLFGKIDYIMTYFPDFFGQKLGNPTKQNIDDLCFNDL